jgi:hypothetical protein
MERSLELSISFLHLHIGYSIFLEMLIELQGSWYYSISFVTFFSLQIGRSILLKSRFWPLKYKNVKEKKQIDRKGERDRICVHYKHESFYNTHALFVGMVPTQLVPSNVI